MGGRGSKRAHKRLWLRTGKGRGGSGKTDGVVGAFTGGLAACATGVSVAIFFGYLVALIFNPRTKTF